LCGLQTFIKLWLKDNPQKIIDEILSEGKKSQILIDGKTEIEILLKQDFNNAIPKLKELEEENEALKFIPGVKRGLQD
jgi:hypothetical protein